MAKIYTSRYSNKELRSGNYTCVGITLGAPKFPLNYELAGNIYDIAPSRALFNVYDRETFTKGYFEKMDKIGVDRVAAQLKKYTSKGKDVVLLCYEDVREPREWCHRLVFAEWWESRTGEKITELVDNSPIKGVKKKIVENSTAKNDEEEFEQMRLF